MDRYIKFTTVSPMKKFIEDAKKNEWDREIKKLNRQLDSVRDLSAVSQSEVHSHNISSPTEVSAVKAANIVREIARREMYKDIFSCALDALSEDEKEIFNGFHFGRKMVSHFVDEYSIAHSCSPRFVYTLKREAEETFCDAVLSLKGKYPYYK